MLGLEANVVRRTRLAQARAVVRPRFRQIQPIGDRQARMLIRNRQRHRDLAVVFLADLAAILPRHPNRMRALLGKASIVDDPCLDRPGPFDRRQHHLPNFAENHLVRPAPLADKMQQRLVLRSRPFRCRHRRHRLHALAFARQHQAQAIVAQRPRPVGVTNHAHKPLDIGRKTRFTRSRPSTIHHSPRRCESQSLTDSNGLRTATF